jgi:lipopolysaccharide export system permease protein
MRQLTRAIDSMETAMAKMKKEQDEQNFYNVQFAKYLDSNAAWQKPTVQSTVKGFDELLPDSARNSVFDRAISQINTLKTRLEISTATFKEKERILTLHKMEWHRKISLSLACFILFLIGAPLGSIIRKGGFGMPMVFAIIFFMIFYFSGTTGEKFAKQNIVSPFMGMWQSTFVLLPICIFLTYKAMQDSQLFNKEFYYRLRKQLVAFLRPLLKKFSLKKQKPKFE